MKRISFTPIVKELQAKNEWGEILGKFCDRINPGRVGHYKPLTPSGIGRLLKQAGYKDTTAIRDLYKELEQATNFSKLFWYKIKNK